MIYLRQSTAGQEVFLGPFLDDTDGKTAETALTIANTDLKVWKHGATSEANKNSGGATHVSGGRYYAVLDATDTDTIGGGEVNCHVAGALPVKVRFCVLAGAVYDVLFGTTAPSTHTAAAVVSLVEATTLSADLVSIAGSTAAANNQRGAALAVRRGTVDSGTTLSVTDATLTESAAGHWAGRVLVFVTGSLAGQAARITAFTPSTDTLDLHADDELTAAPDEGDLYVIL